MSSFPWTFISCISTNKPLPKTYIGTCQDALCTKVFIWFGLRHWQWHANAWIKWMKRLTFDIQIFGSNGFKVISNCRTAANDSILTCKFHTYPDLTIKQLYDISISENEMWWIYLWFYYNFLFQDWDRASNPLVAKGTDVKFPGKPCEKISGNEGQTIYIQLDVEGDPPPKVEWFKVNWRKSNKLLALIDT